VTSEELVKRIQNGENVKENMAALWSNSRSFVAAIAKKYAAVDDMDDLVQQGYLGLHRAVSKYDPAAGVPFLQYAAPWIQQSIKKYLEKCGRLIRFPSYLEGELYRYRRYIAMTKIEKGEYPDKKSVADHLGCSLRHVETLEKASRMEEITSLDKPMDEGEDIYLGDIVADPEGNEEEAQTRAEEEELKGFLWALVDELPGIQPAVIRGRYGEGLTRVKVGEKIGTDKDQVYKEEAKALRTLRLPHIRKKIAEYCDDERIYSSALQGNGVGTFATTWTSSTERIVIRRNDRKA